MLTRLISDLIQDELKDTESPGTAADSIQGNKESRGGNVNFREERELCISNEEDYDNMELKCKLKEGPVWLGPRATAIRLDWTGKSFSSWRAAVGDC